MMKALQVALIVMLAAVASFAQVPTAALFTPNSDVFVGYVTTFPDYGGQYDSNRFNGAEIAFTKNLRPHFAVTAVGNAVFGSTYDVKQFSGTVGPKVNLLAGRVRPYITAQAGYSYQNSNGMYAADHHPPRPAGKSSTESGFTYRMGGGLEYQVTRKFYWRVVSWDVQPQPWGRDTPFYSNWGSGIGYRF